MTAGIELSHGTVAWADLDTVVGREQSGRRPVLVAASRRYLATVDSLAIVVPLTTVDRGWPNHVRVDGPTGLDRPTWAMTEQPRTISRARISSVSGVAGLSTMADVRSWLRDFL